MQNLHFCSSNYYERNYTPNAKGAKLSTEKIHLQILLKDNGTAKKYPRNAYKGLGRRESIANLLGNDLMKLNRKSSAPHLTGPTSELSSPQTKQHNGITNRQCENWAH